MASNENVSINIDSKADLRGFKQAESAASKLNKTIKGLAATLGIAYGSRAVVNFGKASIKAFTDDQKSATKLATAVKNLGLSFEQANIEGFIAKLEQSAAIADDVLRPAFQTLLTTTGDFAKSQELLKTAINVSRGSGEDLSTVVDDLSKAYTGITKGIEKYKLGLSRAQLKSMSFLQIQEKLNKQFKGASKAYLATYAGQMDALTTAAGRAQETIGGALVQALINLSGSGDVTGLIKKIDSVSEAAANATTKLGELAQGVYYSIFKQGYLEFFGLDFGKGVNKFGKMIEEQRRQAQYSTASPYDKGNNAITGYQKDKKAAADAKKAADLQAKLLKQSLDNQKKLTAEQKKQAALKKAGTIFDMEQIQLIAALKGKLSDEDRKRAELQLAILNENVDAATELSKQVLYSQDQSGKLYQYFLTIGDAKIKNPFAFLDQWIIEFQKKLDSLKMPNFAAVAPTSGAVQNFVPDVVYPVNPKKPGDAGFVGPVIPDTNVPAGGGSWNGWSGGISNLNNGTAIELKISGDSALTKAIADNLQVQSLSGIPSSVQRLVSTFG